MHPYLPPGAVIHEQYQDNADPLWSSGAKLGGWILTFLVLYSLLLPKRPRGETWKFWWFLLCSTLHLLFEGWFVWHRSSMVGDQFFLSQLWKEYALSDSRYLTNDTFVLCIEAITVFLWGPLCLLTAFLIARDSHWRHPMQLIACVAHLYGVALYYSTSLYDEYGKGLYHSRPEPVYYWLYYVGFNAPWVIIPAILLWQSVLAIKSAFASAKELDVARSVASKVRMELNSDLKESFAAALAQSSAQLASLALNIAGSASDNPNKNGENNERGKERVEDDQVEVNEDDKAKEVKMNVLSEQENKDDESGKSDYSAVESFIANKYGKKGKGKKGIQRSNQKEQPKQNANQSQNQNQKTPKSPSHEHGTTESIVIHKDNGYEENGMKTAKSRNQSTG
ncbi:hypothetical protein MKZ38_005855 [Zalerion maritima]|uniref:EXPERA domain-containing protein n=1 Tax=Zalerion maritima TaxID=339359 RepID=A0AAD5RJJ9_9PEZI|nr:hypothetical protein MKZ38_005855 [Zalerion maritima]